MTGTETTFDRDKFAQWYATRHLKTDPGILTVYYLPSAAPPREIRFIEVNALIAGGLETPLEPLDFGVDVGGTDSHTLDVLDVTPAQWEAIATGKLALPEGWSLDGAVPYGRKEVSREYA